MHKRLAFLCLWISFYAFAQKPEYLNFDTPMDEMVNLRIKQVQTSQIEPSFDLNIEELSMLDIHRIVVESPKIDIDYNLSIEELADLQLSTYGTVYPSYSMTVAGLSKLILKKEFRIDHDIDISFDLPLECLTKLSIAN